MPIYEYRCTACGAETEVIQKASDAPSTTCEVCAGRLQKLISQSAFQFRGSGWYITDYARKSGDGSKKSETAESTKSGGSENSKPDAASATSDSSKSDSPAAGDSSKKSGGEAAETKKSPAVTTTPTA